MLGAVPETAFFAARGFELTVSYPTIITVDDVERELLRLVKSHDQPGVDILLISCGAPGSDGFSYLSEENIAELYIEKGSPISNAEHISSILVHFWSTGEAYEVFKEKKQVIGGLYEGVVPRHRVLLRPS